MKKIVLQGCTYSPGYSDMRGAAHSMELEKEETGWVMICRDREYYSAPTKVAVYRVSVEAVAEFEDFIVKKRILSLENRLKSKVFITDYSPWSFDIDYEKTALGKTDQEFCSIGQNRIYSPLDRRKLEELKERFLALRGEILSETVEEKRKEE